MSKVALGPPFAIASKGFKSLNRIKPWEILKAISSDGGLDLTRRLGDLPRSILGVHVGSQPVVVCLASSLWIRKSCCWIRSRNSSFSCTRPQIFWYTNLSSKWQSRYSCLAQIIWAIETKEKRFSHKKTFRLVFASSWKTSLKASSSLRSELTLDC